MAELQGIFIQNLKRERNRLGISQAALAEKADLSAGYIGEIESGRKFPSIENVERLAEALEVPAYRLYMTERDLEKLLLEESLSPLSRTRREAFIRDVAEVLSRYTAAEPPAGPEQP